MSTIWLYADMAKTAKEAKLLIWQKENGDITLRYVDVDDGNAASFGDGDTVLKASDRSLARNLSASLISELEK